MNELSATYQPTQTEDKWYEYWLKNKFFEANVNPEKESFTIVIPPPNVTGVLHMGHMLNNTIQDILVRRARMQGYEALWVPGTDHASIATEAKVVRLLREQGIKKSDLTREEFLSHAYDWKNKYGGIILEQLKKLGASCDWNRTGFTMDEGYYKAVIRVFVDLYKKGFIYRSNRMVNWDCEAQTTISNEEIIYKEEGEKAFLYHTKYELEEGGTITIATQRPETIMGDVAIAVNPTDERFKDLIGKNAIVPFIGRKIPIIGDEYVEKDFGTGMLKVTPAHDPNDYEIGQRHNLPIIDTINDDGTLNEKCEMPEMVGKDRFEVRKLITKKLEEAGLLVEKEEVVSRIGRSERTGSVVEPKLSLQWFIKMQEISKTALKVVEDDEIILHPAKFKNTYRHWMENVRDWCISRQLWWGHQIPAYFYGEGDEDFVVAETKEEALQLIKEKTGKEISENDIRQDDDVLDTWASSWLWPIAVFDGFNDDCFDKETGKIDLSKNPELDFFYPTQVLVTAPEILFFWVARMIIAGYEYTGKRPFKDVYLTGIVRDKQGRKMSKSLGNSPDPLDLIAKYGADGVRVGMLFSSPAGNDLPFDEKLCRQGSEFSNKIWQALRLLNLWEKSDIETPKDCQIAITWFESKLNQAFAEIENHYENYRISDALLGIYKLIKDEFCSNYLEMIKPAYGSPIDKATYGQTVTFFEQLMKILHPFMPFLTEEVWHILNDREEKEAILVSEYPDTKEFDGAILKKVDQIFELVSQVRKVRNAKNIPPKEKLDLFVKSSDKNFYDEFLEVIQKLAGVETINFTDEKPSPAMSFVVKGDEFSVPIQVDVEEERQNLIKEIEYTKGFLKSVDKKLSNERFVNNAKAEIVEKERQKKADAEAKIKALEEALGSLV
ncbi:valine--tRNA ligase [Bernardetia sp.]|uniref:valine--tRNA ligase n=1 Tax=Bernardetia sp. TaxID=1937974 RepID=UPI0025C0F0A8|nr:valine--tRNA ligase [Bernardetia sp.]